MKKFFSNRKFKNIFLLVIVIIVVAFSVFLGYRFDYNNYHKNVIDTDISIRDFISSKSDIQYIENLPGYEGNFDWSADWHLREFQRGNEYLYWNLAAHDYEDYLQEDYMFQQGDSRYRWIKYTFDSIEKAEWAYWYLTTSRPDAVYKSMKSPAFAADSEYAEYLVDNSTLGPLLQIWYYENDFYILMIDDNDDGKSMKQELKEFMEGDSTFIGITECADETIEKVTEASTKESTEESTEDLSKESANAAVVSTYNYCIDEMNLTLEIPENWYVCEIDGVYSDWTGRINVHDFSKWILVTDIPYTSQELTAALTENYEEQYSHFIFGVSYTAKELFPARRLCYSLCSSTPFRVTDDGYLLYHGK